MTHTNHYTPTLAAIRRPLHRVFNRIFPASPVVRHTIRPCDEETPAAQLARIVCTLILDSVLLAALVFAALKLR